MLEILVQVLVGLIRWRLEAGRYEILLGTVATLSFRFRFALRDTQRNSDVLVVQLDCSLCFLIEGRGAERCFEEYDWNNNLGKRWGKVLGKFYMI